MNYLMLVCSEDAPLPADADPDNAPEIETWIELCGESRVYGHQLMAPSSARTVRVRGAETLISEGPYVESKEFIAGFDLLTCADLDAAITLAAAHPMTHVRMVELRPFPETLSLDGASEKLSDSETGPGQRFLMIFCVDGVPEADEVEAQIMADSRAWGAALEADHKLFFGSGVQPAETATTVRVRSGQTLLSDGPFIEAKEYLAGIAVVRCADMDEAVELAARHPLAGWHRVEVRPFQNA